MMNSLAKIRNFHTRSARSALSATLVAWLGFILQPCVMAATLASPADSGDAVELSVVTHHGPAESCLHCTGSEDTSAAPVSGCLEPSAAAQANATKGLDLGDGNWSSPALPAQELGVDFTGPQYTGAPRAENLPPPVSLTVFYCVFLE